LSGDRSTFEGRLVPALLGIFGVIAVLVILDVMADIDEGAAFEHVAVEAGIGLAALIGVVTLTLRVIGEARRARHAAVILSGDLETTRAAAAQWRSEAQGLIQGLGSQIDTQFSKWQLTSAEKEVALLLLKGFSHRDVARLRKVTEATARQQARAIYTKAGLTGRHDLAGFFLEDLMLPPASEGNGRLRSASGSYDAH
jgi:DNA-binding NarL/FixJ family response regulator